MRKFLPIIFSSFIVTVFFWQFFFKGLLPIPADTIIGLYHPFRDLYSKDYPNGIPYKNFLITDPVRQQYPWKKLSVDSLRQGKLPLWNPYEMAGKPLLANFQSGIFYPLNIIFFILPFSIAWSLFIIIQPLLGLIFAYYFLRNLKLSEVASFLGGFVFVFSGFSIAWLEWGNINHTALWLPLILLAIDKLSTGFQQKSKIKNQRSKMIWSIIFIFSLTSSFFTGHLQIFFYLFVISLTYLLVRWIQFNMSKRILSQFTIYYLLFTIITSIQWLPTLRFISESARSLDQTWTNEGWFIPWQNIVQFLVPDFFGNPATLNYWGVWNYAEFVGYIGVFSFALALFALFFKRDKTVLFFGIIFFLSLLFAFPTLLAKVPYLLNLPFISTAQPTRLIFLADFSLAVLAAFGLDWLSKTKKEIFYPLSFVGLALGFLWVSVLSSNDPNFFVSKQNLILPSIIFATSLFLIVLKVKKNNLSRLIIYSLVAITILDLFRFGWKFTPFTDEKYLFPKTSILSYLGEQKDFFRIMATDSKILPPNFSSVYKIQSIEGYDPLYIQTYAELIAASERGKSDINPPFGFNRIITPRRVDSKIIDLLGVKYILSLSDLSSSKLVKIMQEGQTKLYENKNYFPRAFFVKQTVSVENKNEMIQEMFKNDLRDIAFVEGSTSSNWSQGLVNIVKYGENKISLKTENEGEGFLVLTDSFYPTWKASIDGKEAKIFRTDFNFRGVIVPEGKHAIEFYNTLF